MAGIITDVDVETLKEYIDDAMLRSCEYMSDSSHEKKAACQEAIARLNGFIEGIRPTE